MKVLIVGSLNSHKGKFAPFVLEQAETLRNKGVVVGYYGIIGNGLTGYFKNFFRLKNKINEFKPDIIHAHYGLSGLLANLQRTVPVVTTYHGSDINNPKVLRLSKYAIRLSKHNIFVSQKNVNIAGVKERYSLIPCGVNMDNFSMITKVNARRLLGWNINEKIIIFAGAFDNYVKDYPLAKMAVSILDDNVKLLELKGYNREQVSKVFCAADALLMTSFTEGSPQVIKEAMVCGCPIVSVDVGDVAEVIDGVDGCYIANRTPEDISNKLKLALPFNGRTKGRERIIELGLTNDIVAKKLINIYEDILGKESKI